jgi:serine/threonine protein kinase
LGTYELVECLGRGGMGEVYRARRVDAEFEMEVAIKLVRAGSGRDLLRRFRAERQILASLDHPCIAHLLDGGVSPEGEPYLVMELVIGQPIDAYCEQRNLPLKDRLQLFRQVCAAVTYAHQRLVVHRDLKPTNILVTPQGAVKLLDFGIAKILSEDSAGGDGEPVTRTSIRAMTPQFSSPEQILGLPVTTATDVYSLGVVLFHLITGRSPYRTTITTTRDAIRDVCETAPIRPSAAALQADAGGQVRQIPDRDLDHIALYALRKEPDKRYSSVEQLSDDVRRYLVGLPVLASGDQLSYRLRKFWNRHRLPVATAGLFLTALLVSLGIALREARIAETQRALAAQHFASVRHLANTFMFQANDAIKDLPGATAARDLLATTSQQYLDALAKEAGADRGLQLDLAQSYKRLGDIQGEPDRQNTGHSQDAMASYTKALGLMESLSKDRPDAAVLSTMATLYAKRGRMRLMVNADAEGGAKDARRAIELLTTVAAMRPQDPSAKKDLALVYVSAAVGEVYTGRFEVASSYANSAVTLMEDLQRRLPLDNDMAKQLAHVYTDAMVFPPRAMTTAEIDRYLDWAQRAIAIDQRLLNSDATHSLDLRRSLYTDWGNIGALLLQKSDFAGAAKAYERALTMLRGIPADADNRQARVDLVRIQMNLGRSLRGAGHDERSETVMREAAAAMQDLLRHNDTKEVQYLLAVTEEELAAIDMKRAQQAQGPARQEKYWNSAHEQFVRSDQRFKSILKGITLEYWDQQPVEWAAAGAARSATALQALKSP